jgi:hypothetical protein
MALGSFLGRLRQIKSQHGECVMITEQIPFPQNNLNLSVCFNEGSVRKPRRPEDHLMFAFVRRRLLNRGGL